jgi:ribosomal protein S18 acetylase RimI-like enzyme
VVETATHTDLAAVAGVLSRAFRDNPGLGGILRGDDAVSRQRVLSGCMLGFARAVLRHGRIDVIRQGGVLVGASLVLPPGSFPMPFRGQVSVAAGIARSRLGRLHRFARADREMHRNHPRDPHHYLWFLGVEPGHQGRGLGSELLRSLTVRADSAQQPCYLETDVERNIGLYRGHGFQVLGERIVPGMDVRMWFMRRPAASRPPEQLERLPQEGQGTVLSNSVTQGEIEQ